MPGFPPSFKMTVQEYEAKAMLLGYAYSNVTHLFYDEGARNIYDPDTLQRLWSLADETNKLSLVPEKFRELALEREYQFKPYLRK